MLKALASHSSMAAVSPRTKEFTSNETQRRTCIELMNPDQPTERHGGFVQSPVSQEGAATGLEQDSAGEKVNGH